MTAMGGQQAKICKEVSVADVDVPFQQSSDTPACNKIVAVQVM
jgi:hypothetical protein